MLCWDVPLKPNYLIYGQAEGNLAPENVDNVPFNIRRRWREVQEFCTHGAGGRRNTYRLLRAGPKRNQIVKALIKERGFFVGPGSSHQIYLEEDGHWKEFLKCTPRTTWPCTGCKSYMWLQDVGKTDP